MTFVEIVSGKIRNFGIYVRTYPYPKVARAHARAGGEGLKLVNYTAIVTGDKTVSLQTHVSQPMH